MNKISKAGFSKSFGQYQLTIETEGQVNLTKHNKLVISLSPEQIESLVFNGSTLLEDSAHDKSAA